MDSRRVRVRAVSLPVLLAVCAGIAACGGTIQIGNPEPDGATPPAASLPDGAPSLPDAPPGPGQDATVVRDAAVDAASENSRDSVTCGAARWSAHERGTGVEGRFAASLSARRRPWRALPSSTRGRAPLGVASATIRPIVAARASVVPRPAEATCRRVACLPAKQVRQGGRFARPPRSSNVAFRARTASARGREV